jgi:hypothetical protein
MGAMRRIAAIAAVVASAALIAGCATRPAPPISAAQLRYARSFRLFTLYWAGKSMDGIRLIQADGLGDYNPTIGVTLYYGNCMKQSITKLGGCQLPLRITTVWYIPHSNVSFGKNHYTRFHGVPADIVNNGDEIEIYTDAMAVDVIGATPKITLEAVRQLTTFNRKPSAAWPAFPPPDYTPGVSLRQLAAEHALQGTTSVTGANQPPSDLQPSPNPSQ